jgi:hypothetical protein
MSICNDDFMMESSANVKSLPKRTERNSESELHFALCIGYFQGKGAKAIQQDVNLKHELQLFFKFRYNVRSSGIIFKI